MVIKCELITIYLNLNLWGILNEKVDIFYKSLSNNYWVKFMQSK